MATFDKNFKVKKGIEVADASTFSSDITLQGRLYANGSAGTNGQVLQSTGTGLQWSSSGGGVTYYFSSTAPSSPNAGDIWIDSDTGIQYTYVNDGSDPVWANMASAGYIIDPSSALSTLTIGTGLSGTSYNGSSAVTIAIDSTVATTSGTQTLTNKTLTAPVISTITNTGTLTLPTSTDTLVGRATTDTLTNKTLTAPVISTITNTGTLTLPTSTDTLVGRATTDTLTNKTISGANNTLTVRIANDVSGLGTGIATFLGTPSSANLASAVTDETGTGALVFGTGPTITPAVATTSTGSNGAGYMGMPQNATTTGAYRLTAADAGTHIYSTATRTITIPGNATGGAPQVAFPIGATIVFIAASGATVTIQMDGTSTDTCLLAGPGTSMTGGSGSRSLAAFGMATLIKITATQWIISGNGLT